MTIATVETTLNRLDRLINEGRFEELETDTLELKSVPSSAGSWKELHKSVCAFLNSRGGIVLLGIKEEQTNSDRKYLVTGWQPHAEGRLKELPKRFTDRGGNVMDLSDWFPDPMIRDFAHGRIAVVLVDELPADLKYAFYDGEAYRRKLTGDHRILGPEIEDQEEFRKNAKYARELQPVDGMVLEDLDLDKLNDYITRLNRPAKVETIKADLPSAMSFLARKCFLRDEKITILGALVCGKHPGDHLGFRCHVHGYVDVPNEIARDKQDLADNILPLMENSFAYVLRNIQVGVSVERGGSDRPQYPEELLRETVNNALAHRDYSIDRQVIISISPGKHIKIQNPGTFRPHQLIEAPDEPIEIRRILPEAKPRNPKLADVLRVFRKWEGRGIGMATLVDMCLADQIDLPYYRFASEEVTLFLRTGRLLDDRMAQLFSSFDGYIEEKLLSRELTEPQKRVLAYLIKSEWANERLGYTVLLTPDNNHFQELRGLEKAGLIAKHAASTPNYPVYTPDRDLVRKDYATELHQLFGTRLDFESLKPFFKSVLGEIYRCNRYSKARAVSAKTVSYSLWFADDNLHHGQNGSGSIKAFDEYYRKIRYAFNKLEKAGYVKKHPGTRGYLLSPQTAHEFLTFDP